MKHFLYIQKNWIGIAILSGGLFLGGCGKNTEKNDISELRNPWIRKAKAKTDQGDQEGALECLNQALDKRPGLAQAHLDAGLLYENFKKDYIRAIYHYQRYLELRPNTEKKDMIRNLIHKANMSFAASVTDQLPGYSEKLKSLQNENTRLKNELREARRHSVKRKAYAPANVIRSPSSGTNLSAKDAVSRTYRVQESETLSQIAAKVYQNPHKWKVIYEANRGTLTSPNQLRSGQVLIIPP